jgi:hypothetical protein
MPSSNWRDHDDHMIGQPLARKVLTREVMLAMMGSAYARYSSCASSSSRAMRRGRDGSVHVAQKVSGMSLGAPAVFVKFGIGLAASSMSRLSRGAASASLRVSAGDWDWK